MDIYKKTFLDKCVQQAQNVFAMPWPEMQAAEAALESNFGISRLAIADNNLFGMKQHNHPIFGTHNLPTKEFLHNAWVVVDAPFVHYPNLAACFQDRWRTLARLCHIYQNYEDAMDAKDAISYVIAVSKTWSTDPARAQKCIDIYNQYHAIIKPTSTV